MDTTIPDPSLVIVRSHLAAAAAAWVQSGRHIDGAPFYEAGHGFDIEAERAMFDAIKMAAAR